MEVTLVVNGPGRCAYLRISAAW